MTHVTHHKPGLRPHAVGHGLNPPIRQEDAVLASDGVSVTLFLLIEVVPDVILNCVPKSGLKHNINIFLNFYRMIISCMALVAPPVLQILDFVDYRS